MISPKVTLGNNYNDETNVAILEAFPMGRDHSLKGYRVKEALKALKDK